MKMFILEENLTEDVKECIHSIHKYETDVY